MTTGWLKSDLNAFEGDEYALKGGEKGVKG